MKRTFYRPKLEAGVNATGWQPCSTYTGSLIRQTHDAILLEVDEIVSGVTEDYTQKIGALQVTADAISGSVSSLSSTVSGHTEQIGQLVIKSDAISGSVSSLSDTVSGHTQQIASLTIKADSISGSVSNLSDTVSGHTQQIGSLTLRADEFQTEITELQSGEVGLNIIPANGWKNKDGEFVEPDEAMCYSASTSYIVSPKIYLDPGEYTVSNYNNQSNHFVVKYGDTTITPSSAYTAPNSDTYQGCNRYVDTFSATTSGDYTFTYGDNAHNSKFYRPKLEKGNKLTYYTNQEIQYSSFITQTSQQISLEVQTAVSENDAVAQFKRTGIDITNGKVEINADNTVINGNLNLNAQDDADALTLNDDDGVDRVTVTSEEIGPLSGQSQSSSQTIAGEYNLAYGDSTVINLDTKYFAAGSKITPGFYWSPRVAMVVCTYKDSNNNWQPQNFPSPSSCQLIAKLVNTSDPTINYTLNGTMVTYQPYSLELHKPSTNNPITITTAGSYYVQLTIKFANNATTSQFAQTTKYRCYVYMDAAAKSKTLVGADGIYSTNGESNFVHYAGDGFHSAKAQRRLDKDTGAVLETLGTAVTSVGAMRSDYHQQLYNPSDPESGYITIIHDKYTWGGAGPSHIADFNGTSYASWTQHWTNTSDIANQTDVFPSSACNNSSHPFGNIITTFGSGYDYSYYIFPSTDIIRVNFVGAQYYDTFYLDLASLEHSGHIVTIINWGDVRHTHVMSSNGAGFFWTKDSGYGYTGYPQTYTGGYEFPAYPGWTISKWIFANGQSYIPGTENACNGMWQLLDVKWFTYIDPNMDY